MEKTVVEKAVDLTVGAWPIAHPGDLAKVVGIFQIMVEEGHFAKDDEIFQYITRDDADDTRRRLAWDVQRIYEAVEATVCPSGSKYRDYRYKEEWVRQQLFGSNGG